MGQTQSDTNPASTGNSHRNVAAAKRALVDQSGLSGEELRAALTAWYDDWLISLMPSNQEGIALVACGGLGRQEPAPFSDVDLLIVHNGQIDGLGDIADGVWYPIWDAGIGLDHSVRTVQEAIRAVQDDLKTAFNLLSARHIAGDAALSGQLRSQVFGEWRRGAPQRLPELRELTQQRWNSVGNAAFLLEPDLKNARGGLRDAHTIHALAAAQLVDEMNESVQSSYRRLLDVRGELQRRVGRPADRLLAQEQDSIAAVFGADADGLLRAVSQAARTVAYAADSAWRQAETEWRDRRSSRRRRLVSREPLADGVVEQDGEVVLARDADPGLDPTLLVRTAAAAAVSGLPLAPHTLQRLSVQCGPMPTVWPEKSLESLLELLGAGSSAVGVFEALDQAGLLTRLIPEWDRVRFLPQRNPVHVFTVDRHLIETCVQAAALSREVSRPDLLLLAALLHDIGKGSADDHSVAGAEIARQVATRVGLVPSDVDIVVGLVRHHLLLPDTATRRDLDDPATIQVVLDVVGNSSEFLELLHALSEADALATGPAAHSSWKFSLMSDLVHRTAAALDGTAQPETPTFSADEEKLLSTEDINAITIAAEPGNIVRIALRVSHPDQALSHAAGVLALHQLDVQAATVFSHGESMLSRLTATPRFGRAPDADLLRSDLARAISGALPLSDRVAAKDREYRQISGPPARVLWFDNAATHDTILELRATDSIGLLYRVSRALEKCGIVIRRARISTLGSAVVDAFYLQTRSGGPVSDSGLRDQIAAEVLAAAD